MNTDKTRTIEVIHRAVSVQVIDLWCARRELNLRPTGSKAF